MEYCFFTPSYRNDLERLKILRLSVKRFVKESLIHYVIVPKEDFYLFKEKFSDDNLVIVLKENDFIKKQFYPSKLYSFVNKVLPNQSWRFNKSAGRPGWIIQQIVKLSIPDIVKEDLVIILDSDMFFIKPCSIFQIVPQSNGRILIRSHPSSEAAMQREFMSISRDILKIPPGNTDFHYVSWPVIWYKDLVLQFQEYLSNTYNRHWQNVLHDAGGVLSEFCLYGIYVEEVLKLKNLDIISKPLHVGIWDKQDFQRFLSDDFSIDDDIFFIVVQSNLEIEVNEYYQKINSFFK